MADVAVVTGAGSGLGRALALALCERGVPVAGLGRRADALAKTEALAGPGRFLAVPADVADPGAARAALGHVGQELGPVTILINNAAVYPRRDFLDETAESFMATVAVNLGGMVACTAAVLPGMVERGAGRILNVSTFADLSPIPLSSAYSVSKGAARILTRALVADLGDRFPDIVINDWMPGMLATGMGIADGLDPAKAARWGAALALWRDRSLTGTLWEQDREILPPRSFRRRLVDRLTFQTPAPPRRVE